MMNKKEHQPVLLNEAILGLEIKSDGIYVDATFGRGGHAKAILDKLSNKGRLFAIDKDPEAIQIAERDFENDDRFKVYHGSFVELSEWVKQLGLYGCVDGVLLDLGVSSPQLDNPERGFSFLRDGPLDMRMNPGCGVSAEAWLRQVDSKVLADVFRTYGEERYAGRIARAIVQEREEEPINTTKRLADIISKAHPKWEKHKHPATRCFQAIRIFINRELEELSICLEQCLDVLKIGGRLAVISFHSLEDRIVKRFIKKQERGGEFPVGLPIKQDMLNPRLKRVGRMVKPAKTEIDNNPRARSAVLRIAEKIS